MPAMILESPVSKDKDELIASKQDDSSSFILTDYKHTLEYNRFFFLFFFFLKGSHCLNLFNVLILSLVLNFVDFAKFVELSLKCF